MNEQLKFSWGHIIAFLALIVLSYITFSLRKRPVLLWQSRLKKMSSASGYERNGV